MLDRQQQQARHLRGEEDRFSPVVSLEHDRATMFGQMRGQSNSHTPSNHHKEANT